jgi:adenosylmethionine-8-amino-7-oxononanoate aminotransferase
VIVSRQVCDVLEADPDYLFRHGYTYSGHPAGAAAALVNLDIIESEGLVKRANDIGDRFVSGLSALVGDGILAAYRGVGAIWAAQLPEGTEPAHTVAIRDKMLDAGVICRPIGDSLAFCPPLIIDDADIDRCIDVMATAIG